ncbi:MAG: hypothetical protein WBB28_01315 [Crinalium sp.]
MERISFKNVIPPEPVEETILDQRLKREKEEGIQRQKLIKANSQQDYYSTAMYLVQLQPDGISFAQQWLSQQPDCEWMVTDEGEVLQRPTSPEE